MATLSTRVFEMRTVTGSELFSLLTCPHTTIFTSLSTFSSLGMSTITNLGDNTVLACEIVSSGCRPRLQNARAAQTHEKTKSSLHFVARVATLHLAITRRVAATHAKTNPNFPSGPKHAFMSTPKNYEEHPSTMPYRGYPL